MRLVPYDEDIEVNDNKLILKGIFSLFLINVFYLGVNIVGNLIYQEIYAKVEVLSEFKIILNNLKESIIILSDPDDSQQIS